MPKKTTTETMDLFLFVRPTCCSSCLEAPPRGRGGGREGRSAGIGTDELPESCSEDGGHEDEIQ